MAAPETNDERFNWTIKVPLKSGQSPNVELLQTIPGNTFFETGVVGEETSMVKFEQKKRLDLRSYKDMVTRYETSWHKKQPIISYVPEISFAATDPELITTSILPNFAIHTKIGEEEKNVRHFCAVLEIEGNSQQVLAHLKSMKILDEIMEKLRKKIWTLGRKDENYKVARILCEFWTLGEEDALPDEKCEELGKLFNFIFSIKDTTLAPIRQVTDEYFKIYGSDVINVQSLQNLCIFEEKSQENQGQVTGFVISQHEFLTSNGEILRKKETCEFAQPEMEAPMHVLQSMMWYKAFQENIALMIGKKDEKSLIIGKGLITQVAEELKKSKQATQKILNRMEGMIKNINDAIENLRNDMVSIGAALYAFIDASEISEEMKRKIMGLLNPEVKLEIEKKIEVSEMPTETVEKNETETQMEEEEEEMEEEEEKIEEEFEKLEEKATENMNEEPQIQFPSKRVRIKVYDPEQPPKKKPRSQQTYNCPPKDRGLPPHQDPLFAEAQTTLERSKQLEREDEELKYQPQNEEAEDTSMLPLILQLTKLALDKAKEVRDKESNTTWF